MTNQSNQGQVYTARSLEEARRILLSAEKFRFKFFLYRIFIKCWVFTANLSLRILKFILFKRIGSSSRQFKNIVVYTVGILGDNVVMLPALAAIRRRYQNSRITVITNCQIWDQQGAIGVLGPSPFKDRLIVLDDHPVQRKGFRFVMDQNRFDGVRCDLFVNLSPFGNRGWIGAVAREMIFAKKLGAKYAVGFRMSTYTRRGLFNKVQHHFVKNEPRRSLEVLKELGLTPIKNKDLLSHDPDAKESVLRKIKEKGCNRHSLYVINPGAKYESKCWPPERFAEVAKYVAKEYNAAIIVTGINSEKEIGDKIVKESDGIAINLSGETTIQELVELLRISKGCITNDTGTMHLSAMVRIPTVALFSGRNSPTHWLPLGENVVSAFSIIDCIYCYNDYCERPDCLTRIQVTDVLKTMGEIIDIP